MMPSDPEESIARMVDAFVHPPRIVEVGDRNETDAGRVQIVSHVELWPWRVVVRGLLANKYPSPSVVFDPVATTAGDLPAFAAGRVSGIVSGAKRAERRETLDMFMGWALDDDLGSDYRLAGALAGGSGGDTWAEFAVEFQPNFASRATQLRLTAPDGRVVSVNAGGA